MASRRRTLGNSLAPTRFLIFLALFAVVTSGLFATGTAFRESLMGGFDCAAAIFLVSLWPLLNDGGPDSIRRHAAENDANRGLILILSGVIGTVLLLTIRAELEGPGKPLASLIIATLTLAWLFGNMIYALHYAHLYYGGEGKADGGLSFPGKDKPDYWDFVYFSFTLGMTFQTSDVEVDARAIRRVVLAQSVVAFVFNIGILAFTINTLGGGEG